MPAAVMYKLKTVVVISISSRDMNVFVHVYP